VRSLSLARLQAADAGDGEPVPTLEQVLQLVEGRLTVMCELKATPGEPEFDQRLVDAVLGVIERAGARTWAAVHSFNAEMVARARQTEPRVSAAIISSDVVGEEVDRLLGALLKRNGQALSIEHACIDRALVVKVKRRQVTVWTWTPDEEADWARLVDAGVDGIITNYPHRLRDYLAR
jgi:glycerophosphoryl diester phosphodiesterase